MDPGLGTGTSAPHLISPQNGYGSRIWLELPVCELAILVHAVRSDMSTAIDVDGDEALEVRPDAVHTEEDSPSKRCADGDDVDGDEALEVRPDAAHTDAATNEEGSPSKRCADGDADADLERMLARRRVDDESRPSWAADLVTLQQSMCSQLSTMSRDMHSFVSRVERIEAFNASQKFEEMQSQIRELKSLVDELRDGKKGDDARGSPSEARRGEPSMPRRSVQIPPPQSLRSNVQPSSASTPFGHYPDTDFCHIVAGGRPEDTRRKIIEEETWALAENFGREAGVESVKVFNPRATSSHIYLSQVSPEAARARFYDIQKKRSKTFTSKCGGEPVWLSPSRTPEKTCEESQHTGCPAQVATCAQGGGF